jgi:hypothetical protein
LAKVKLSVGFVNGHVGVKLGARPQPRGWSGQELSVGMKTQERPDVSTSPVTSRFPFVLHEGQIGRSVGHAIPPLRVFTLEGLGMDKDEFLSFLRPTFSLLHIDQYDSKRNRLAFLKKRFPEESRRLDKFLVEQYSEHEDLDAIADLLARLELADLHEFDRIGLTNRRKRSIARDADVASLI